MAESRITLTTEKFNPMTDEIRIIQAAKQYPRVFGELYKLYVEQVFRYLYSKIGNLHDAENITSQTFLAAFESFDKFRQDGHFASWLFGIARNKAMDHFRRLYRSTQMDGFSEGPAEDNTLAGIIKTEQQEEALSKLIQALPKEDRELIRLRFLAEMSFPEIARFLHRNEAAVKKSIYRLLARLHSQLEVSNE
ncbi:MAG TPA: sigma-70 family RNA polymerase sigma factor [Brevefilum fermentans]|nr:sigma-70 family RNA polymerase sigma factor [Brevefilum fermentans]